MKSLKELGVNIFWHDKFIANNTFNHEGEVKHIKEEISKFDSILIVTNHDNTNYNYIFNNAKLIIDTRGVYKNEFTNVINA